VNKGIEVLGGRNFLQGREEGEVAAGLFTPEVATYGTEQNPLPLG